MQYVEEIRGSEFVKCTNGTSITTVAAVEAQEIEGGSSIQLKGRVTTSAEILTGATLITLPLRMAPKAEREIHILAEPAYVVAISTGGLIKAVGAIPSGKKLNFESVRYLK